MWETWVWSLGWEENSYPLWYSGMENLMGCIVHGVTESDMTEWLSLHFTCLYPFLFIYFSEILSYSFVQNIFLYYLILPNSLSFFYVWCKCVTFPDLKKWSYIGDNLWGSASDPTLGCIGPSFVAGPTIVGVLIGSNDSQPSWLPDSWLVWLCWSPAWLGVWSGVPGTCVDLLMSR